MAISNVVSGGFYQLSTPLLPSAPGLIGRIIYRPPAAALADRQCHYPSWDAGYYVRWLLQGG